MEPQKSQNVASDRHNGSNRGLSLTAPATLIAVGSLVALLIVVLTWHRPGYVIGQIDFFPDLNPLNLLLKTVDAWGTNKSPFGQWSFPTYAPYYALTWLLEKAVGTDWAQIVLFFLFLAVAWLGVYRLALRIGARPLAAAAAAWFYVFGPEAQSTVTWITASAFAATLPWVVLILFNAAEVPRERKTLQLAAALLAFFVFPVICSTPQLFFEFAIAALVFYLFTRRASQDRRAYDLWVFQTTAIVAVCSVWWVLPVCVAILSSTVSHATNPSDVSWTFARASLLNVFRFNSAWTWNYVEYSPYAASYDANALAYSSGFAGILAFAYCTAKAGDRFSPLVKFLLTVALVGFFLTKGLHPPLAWLNAALMRVPGFFLLIEPAGATLVTLLCCSLAVAIAFEIAAEHTWWRAHRSLPAVIATLLVLWIGSSAYPLLTKQVFHARDAAPSMYVALPQYWRDAARYIDSASGPGAILVLPEDDFYERWYEWGYRGVDLIPATVFRRDVFLPGSSLDYLTNPKLTSISDVVERLLHAHSSLLPPVLRSLNVRFVVCREDLLDSSGADLNACGMAEESNVSFRRFGKLVVFDLGATHGKYAIWHQFVRGDYSGMTAGSILELQALQEPLPRFQGGLAPKAPMHALFREAPAKGSSHANADRYFSTDTSGPLTIPVTRGEVAASFAAAASQTTLLSMKTYTTTAGATLKSRPLANALVVGRTIYTYNVSASPVPVKLTLLAPSALEGDRVELSTPSGEVKGKVTGGTATFGLKFPPGFSQIQVSHGVSQPLYLAPGSIRIQTAAPEISISTHGSGLYDVPVHSIFVSTGTPVDIPLSDHPTVTLKTSAVNMTIAPVVTLRVGNTSYVTFIPPAAGPIDLASAIPALLPRKPGLLSARIQRIDVGFIPETNVLWNETSDFTLAVSAPAVSYQAVAFDGYGDTVQIASQRPARDPQTKVRADLRFSKPLPQSSFLQIATKLPSSARIRYGSIRQTQSNGEAISIMPVQPGVDGITIKMPPNDAPANLSARTQGLSSPTLEFASPKRSIISPASSVARFALVASQPLGIQSSTGVSLITAGKAPLAAAPNLLCPRRWGSFAVARVTGSPSIVTNGQTYDGAWGALLFGGGLHYLRHYQANLWENAWLVPHDGVLFFFNFVTVGELLSAAGGLLVITLCIVRANR